MLQNWIGNEKKRRGLAVKRNRVPAREAKTYVEGKLRKKSAFSVFKSEFLAKEGKWSCCLFNFCCRLFGLKFER